MKNFIFHNPTKIIFGKDILKKVGLEVAQWGSRVMLVYGQNSIKKNGVYDQVVASLNENGIKIVEFFGVKGNPVLSHARAGALLAKQEKVDVILAVGGGSVLDECKAIAAGAALDADIWDLFLGKEPVLDALPLITVLTLPATGSEMNGGMVITNDETNEKFGFGAPVLYPKVSFLDPETTYSLPAKQVGYACSDIMSHLMEGYYTNTANFLPVQEHYIEGVLNGVMESVLVILEDPENYAARASFMWGATLGWNGLGIAGVPGASTPSHALEHPISALYDLPHGAGLSITTPALMRYKKDSIAPQILKFGKNVLDLDTNNVEEVIMALESFYLSIGTPIRLSDAGVKNPDIEAMALESEKLFTMWGIPNYYLNDIRAIYELMV